MRKIFSQSGFTLIELIVSLVIISIIAMLIGPIMGMTIDAIGYQMNRADLAESANLSFARMSREIRLLRNDTSVVTATATQFEFIATSGRQIRYRVVGPQLMRTDNGVENALADRVNSLNFTYFADDGSVIAAPVTGASPTNIRLVRIDLRLQNGVDILSSEISVRPPNLRHESYVFG